MISLSLIEVCKYHRKYKYSPKSNCSSHLIFYAWLPFLLSICCYESHSFIFCFQSVKQLVGVIFVWSRCRRKKTEPIDMSYLFQVFDQIRIWLFEQIKSDPHAWVIFVALFWYGPNQAKTWSKHQTSARQ